MKLDDWIVIGLVTAGWVTGTVYLFRHPSSTDFITWSSLAATTTSAYHALRIHDDKKPDA